MKKLIIAVAAIIAIAGSSCSDSGKKSVLQPVVRTDSATAVACNIRFFDVDSVLRAYTLAQELTAEQQKEVLAFQSAARAKDSELQRMQANIQNKYNSNGYLTEESMNADLRSLQQRQTEASNWANTHQTRLDNLTLQIMQRLQDSLQNFLKDYNAVYNYDAILDKKAGFFKEELDITDQIIEGMNERYAANAEKK